MEANDMAAMREALEYASRVLARWRQDAPFSAWNEYGEAIDKCRTALAKPPRNCDVGTAEEQAERFILFCRRNSFGGVCNDSCKFSNVNRRLGWQEIGQARCFPFWAQMPYEGGGEKR